ncbi:hypothetical protein ACFY1U_28450 [Streptomyces sp. NPDC001351]|jgi:hypothetical protein|uniref:hypothetical protein n=1 Tax=Streptomyces sp. NPDC001351 TaxID=3364564 RepID=UPI0036C4F098
MPSAPLIVPVEGTVAHSPEGPLLRLSRRLDGHDTFLTGSLDIEDSSVPVRILTLDDVTVLRPANSFPAPADGEHWRGRLHLPHGLRPRSIPPDLNAAAHQGGRSLDALDEAELRYVLTFLSEATTADIRHARIEAVVCALPATTGRTR